MARPTPTSRHRGEQSTSKWSMEAPHLFLFLNGAFFKFNTCIKGNLKNFAPKSAHAVHLSHFMLNKMEFANEVTRLKILDTWLWYIVNFSTLKVLDEHIYYIGHFGLRTQCLDEHIRVNILYGVFWSSYSMLHYMCVCV